MSTISLRNVHFLVQFMYQTSMISGSGTACNANYGRPEAFARKPNSKLILLNF